MQMSILGVRLLGFVVWSLAVVFGTLAGVLGAAVTAWVGVTIAEAGRAPAAFAMIFIVLLAVVVVLTMLSSAFIRMGVLLGRTLAPARRRSDLVAQEDALLDIRSGRYPPFHLILGGRADDVEFAHLDGGWTPGIETAELVVGLFRKPLETALEFIVQFSTSRAEATFLAEAIPLGWALSRGADMPILQLEQFAAGPLTIAVNNRRRPATTRLLVSRATRIYYIASGAPSALADLEAIRRFGATERTAIIVLRRKYYHRMQAKLEGLDGLLPPGVALPEPDPRHAQIVWMDERGHTVARLDSAMVRKLRATARIPVTRMLPTGELFLERAAR